MTKNILKVKSRTHNYFKPISTMSAIEQEWYKILTNQYQAFNNVKKENFIDFRSYYKSLFFEILRDTREIAKEVKIKEIVSDNNIKLSTNEINWNDPYIIKRRKVLEDSTYKDIIESAWKAKAIELSRIIYSVNVLDTSKKEEDYKEVLNTLLDKREELLRKVDPYSKNNSFSPSENMNDIRLSHTIKIESINNDIPMIEKPYLDFLSKKEEVIKSTMTIGHIDENSIKEEDELVKLYLNKDPEIINHINSLKSWNYDWVWPESIRKRRINIFLDFAKKWSDYLNKLEKESTLTPLEMQEFRWLWKILTTFLKEILELSPYSISFNKELIRVYDRNFSMIKGNWRLVKYKNNNKNSEFRQDLISMFDYVDKEVLFITSI